ncbi:hypothetical protein D3C85_1551950 [compost metagenome]
MLWHFWGVVVELLRRSDLIAVHPANVDVDDGSLIKSHAIQNGRMVIQIVDGGIHDFIAAIEQRELVRMHAEPHIVGLREVAELAKIIRVLRGDVDPYIGMCG